MHTFVVSLRAKTKTGVEFTSPVFDGCGHVLTSGMFRRSVTGAFLCLVVRIPVVLVLTVLLTRLLGGGSLGFGKFFHAYMFLPYTASLMSCSLVFHSVFTASNLVGDVLVGLKVLSAKCGFLKGSTDTGVMVVLTLV